MAEIFVRDTIRDLNRIERVQLPFVLAKTLTQTARGAAQAGRIRTRKAFDLHGEFIPKGIRFRPASKSDLLRFGFIESDVHTAERISTFMPIHERGGIRKPTAGAGRDKGRAFAIPGEDLRERSFRTRSGRVRKRWRPGTLLQGYSRKRAERGPRSGRTNRRKAFVRRGRGGVPLVLRRRGPKRYPLERLYIFEPQVKIDADWGLEQAVRRYVGFAFTRKFERNMKDAV